MCIPCRSSSYELRTRPRRKHMVFLGGAVLGDFLRDKPEHWISKKDYEEEGMKVVRKLGPIS